jgi:hypothetical protein
MRDDADPEKRFPLPGVQVTDTDGFAAGPAATDDNGVFELQLRPNIPSGQSLNLLFIETGYQKKTSYAAVAADALYTFYLWPDFPNTPVSAQASPPAAANVVEAAYVFAASPALTFQIPNQGNVRCNGKEQCSPDGKWKANVVTSPPLDAGAGNIFASGHARCVAGPCAWSSIEPNGAPKPGQRTITATVRNWSDTVTYRLSGVTARQ